MYFTIKILRFVVRLVLKPVVWSVKLAWRVINQQRSDSEPDTDGTTQNNVVVEQGGTNASEASVGVADSAASEASVSAGGTTSSTNTVAGSTSAGTASGSRVPDTNAASSGSQTTQANSDEQSNNRPSLVRSTVTGIVSSVVGYIMTAILLAVTESDGITSDLIEVSGLVYYNAQFVDAEFSAGGDSLGRYNFITDGLSSLPSVVYHAIPALVLFVAGFRITRSVSVTDRVNGAVSGATIALGTTVFALVGTFIFELSQGTTSTKLPIIGSLFFVGLTFPAVVGAAGGLFASTLAEESTATTGRTPEPTSTQTQVNSRENTAETEKPADVTTAPSQRSQETSSADSSTTQMSTHTFSDDEMIANERQATERDRTSTVTSDSETQSASIDESTQNGTSSSSNPDEDNALRPLSATMAVDAEAQTVTPEKLIEMGETLDDELPTNVATVLERHADSDDPDVRLAVCRVCAEIEDKRATDILKQLRIDTNNRVASAAVNGLE